MKTYNNNWLVGKYADREQPEMLLFWGHQPAKDGSLSVSCFSQWWQVTFVVDNISYATAEHWMMAEKAKLFGDMTIREQIIKANSPADVKKSGRLIQGFDSSLWDMHKYEIVLTGNYYKFSQHPALG